jgi:hypothetical protein
MRRILQHDPGELGGRGGSDDLTVASLFDESRDQSGMVYMGMGQKEGLYLSRVKEKGGPVGAVAVSALAHPAIDKELPVFKGQVIA